MHEIKREKIRRCLLEVYQSLDKYGYNPINQLTGYLLSGDPTYITAKERARYKIQEFEREDILAEIVVCFFEGSVKDGNRAYAKRTPCYGFYEGSTHAQDASPCGTVANP